MPRVITSHSNETIKRIRSLREKKFRAREGLFLAEGMRIVAEAVEAGAVPQMLVHAEEARGHPLLDRLIRQCEAAGGDVIETTRDILHKITEKDNPQSLVGVFPIRHRQLADIDRNASFVWIVCQSLKDPGNLGTILRTLAWFGGFRCLLSPDSVDVHNGKVVRASMGAIFHVPVEIDVPLDTLRARFARIACLDLGGKPLASAGFREFDCYLFGNEARGLPAAAKALASAFTIPGTDAIESLNVAASVNISLYELNRPA